MVDFLKGIDREFGKSPTPAANRVQQNLNLYKSNFKKLNLPVFYVILSNHQDLIL